MRLLSLTLTVLATAALAADRAVIIEDFESAPPILVSYPDQDAEPLAWEITTDNPYAGSGALRIFGNSWKVQSIAPVALADTTVWQLAVYIERLGEMQAFGIGDGTDELLYTFAGEQLPQADKWWTVYQGAFATDQWREYILPIGEDWLATHGGATVIDRLYYINDDDSGQAGITVYDEILDVSADQPIAPQAEIVQLVTRTEKLEENRWRVGVQFHGEVFDPDSGEHDFFWDFGDSSFSSEQSPFHDFIVEADYPFTVSLTATDPSGLAGTDTCRVAVEPGEGALPLTVNFVGDIMTCRSFESPGGIIDTYGVEAIFAPTLPIFGDAADVSVCNLECAYTDRGSPHPTKSVVFRSRPENIAGIVSAGVDIANLGNNHIIDYGQEGMLQTMSLLDSLEIIWSGAGTNDHFALAPCYRSEKGLRLAFLSMSNRDGRLWNYQPFLDAGASKPGFGFLIPKNLEKTLGDSPPVADVTIIQLHSGSEYETQPPDREHRDPHAHVELAEIGPDDPEFRFRVEPSEGDRALRRMAADLGADVVINHHPHVLQGFEAHNGKLIAHSLGNFIFDLYYPETMPTMVLTLEIDETGICGYRVKPAWIDDYIPQPAVGMLGREILDRLADYSRPMNAVLAVDETACEATIHIDGIGVETSVTETVVTADLHPHDGYLITPPIELSGEGSLSRLVSVEGPADWEMCWGREILWHGGFENEGASFWDVNTGDEWLDDTQAWRGLRSLALRREAGDGFPVGTDLEKHLPCDPTRRHSFSGWLKADNAADAIIMARFYPSRYASTPLSSTDIGPRFTGSADWFHQWCELVTPTNGIYFELRASNDEPATGSGMAWFDGLAFIEWEDWRTSAENIDIPAPNNARYLQLRCPDTGASSLTLRYEETRFGQTSTGNGPSIPPAAEAVLSPNYPNPFNPSTSLDLLLPDGSGDLAVDLRIYDVRGREVMRLYSGLLPAGSRQHFTWAGRDDEGRPVASGVYFARASVGGRQLSRKMVLLK